jgi:hypothetical protein
VSSVDDVPPAMQLVIVILGVFAADRVTALDTKLNSTSFVSQNRSVTLPRCHDITPLDLNSSDISLKRCAKGVQWAMTTGIKLHSDWYSSFQNLISLRSTTDSQWANYQCALWMKHKNGLEANGSEAHLCSQPCTAQPLFHCPGGSCSGANPGVPAIACTGDVDHCIFAEWSAWTTWTCVLNATSTRTRSRKIDAVPSGWKDSDCSGSTTDEQSKAQAGNCSAPPVPTVDEATPGGGLAWYWWALMALAALAVMGGLVYFCSPRSKPQKKKRAVNKQTVPLAAAPAPAVVTFAPVATRAVPMPSYTYAAAPVTTAVAPPVYVEAPVSYAAPASVSYAAPAYMSDAAPASVTPYTGPVTTAYAAPAAPYPIAAEPVSGAAGAMFNMIDSNHDGSISRAEFAAAMGR